jgi:predicted RNase H-like HicB family nuclease
MDQPKYRIEIFWSGEDGGYVANVPDLRYCSAFGETYEEALHEVLVAMELHLDTLREEGKPIPEPRSRRVVGVRADMSDPSGTVQIVEEVAVSSTEDIGQVADQLADAASQIVSEVSEGAEQVMYDAGEGAGQIVSSQDLQDEGVGETRRSGRRSDR